MNQNEKEDVSTVSKTINNAAIANEALLSLLSSYVASGLSPVPVDIKSKRPLVGKGWQNHRTTILEIEQWIQAGHTAFGIVCGEPSGGLEILDFDDYHQPGSFEQWKHTLPTDAAHVLHSLPITQTQHGGFHVLYRTNILEGNQKLARRPYDITLDGEPKHVKACGENCNGGDTCKAKTLSTFIETRNKGGQALEPPSPGYTLLQGDFTNMPRIDDAIRKAFFYTARKLSREEMPHTSKKINAQQDIAVNSQTQSRPGDDFNERATWESILAYSII